MATLKLAALSLCLIASTPAFAGTSSTCTGKTGQPGSFQLSIESGGIPRTYRLHVPAQYDPTANTPLLLSFHGVTSSGQQMEEGTKIIPRSDSAGFIVAHPDGYGASWNAGWCCAPASTEDIDDVQFSRDLVAAISQAYCIDPARVYAMGFSNGAFMSNRLGCEAADLFAAIGSHSGEIAIQSCAPSRPMPVYHIHGRTDTVVPWRLGQESVKEWADLNGCSTSTTPVYEKGVASCVVYSGCPGQAQVEFCTVKRFGHDWAMYENTGDAIDATDQIWDFMKDRTLP